MPAGRPSKFKPEYCSKLINHMSGGLSYQSFPAVVDTCIKTLYEWEQSYPEFLHAKNIGRQKQQLYFEETGRRAIEGGIKDFNATAFVWMSKNMLGWRDKQDIEISGKDGGPIKTIAMNINADAQSLTDGELRNAVLKAIANKQEDTHDQIERTAPSRISD